MSLQNRSIKILLLLVAVCISLQALAQQQYQFSHQQFFPEVFNPAYAGMHNDLQINAVYRQQWLNLTGAPSSQLITASIPVPLFNSGFGFQLSNDQLGAARQSSVALGYNYKLYTGKTSYLSAGVKFHLLQYALDGTQLLTPDGNYEPDLDHMDPFLSEQILNNLYADADFGLAWLSENIRAGIGINRLLPAKYQTSIAPDNNGFANRMHLNGDISFKIQVFDNILISPSLFVHSDLVELQTKANLLMRVGEKYDLGLGYRGYAASSIDALIFTVGLKVWNNFSCHYSYDLTISGLNDVQSGSHEISVGYHFQNLLPASGRKVIYNPRYL